MTAPHSVLVIDDEEGIRENLRDLLDDAGYEVSVAGDGIEAMRQLEEHPPSVVILDLLLPFKTGTDVYDAMQRIPSLAKIPVLVTTSDPTRSPPGVPVLAKPIDVEQLLELVGLCTHGLDHTTSLRAASVMRRAARLPKP